MTYLPLRREIGSSPSDFSAEMLYLFSFFCCQFIRKICKTSFSLSQKKKLKTKTLPRQSLLFSILSVFLSDSTQSENIRNFYRRKSQSQTDVKKFRCLSSFNLGQKALISEVTVVRQILALIYYVSVALI